VDFGLRLFELSERRGPRRGHRRGHIFFCAFRQSALGAQIFDLLTHDKDNLIKQLNNIQKTKSGLPDDIIRLSKRVEALRIRIEVDAEGQDKQNRFISWSAGVGTIAWGFGDSLAKYLQAAVHLI
jgi:hypothetical protein